MMRTLLIRTAAAAALLVWLAAAAHAQSTTFAFGPVSGPSFLRTKDVPAADVMNCVLTQTDITNATKLAYISGNASGTGTMGLAVYSQDGATKIAAGTVAYTGAAEEVRTITGLSAFSLDLDTPVWQCWCSSSGSGTFSGPRGVAAYFGAMLNANGTRLGTATSTCTAGVPPDPPITVSPATVDPMTILYATDTP